MIYPTRLAVLVAAAGAPVALLVALTLAQRWYAALAWPAALLLLVVLDALRGARPGQARAGMKAPAVVSVGEEFEAILQVMIDGAAPAQVQVSLEAGPLLAHVRDDRAWLPVEDGKGAGAIEYRSVRRGTARIERVWMRWRGALGLVWKQVERPLEASIAIVPDIRPVHEKGARIFQRQALQGLVAQFARGDGSDFDALVEFRAGMDRRVIDWKQSARHIKLFGKEYRTERNNQIVFAVDCGRQMCEPVAGLSRLDRTVSAMLLTGWIALKLGDRVALHAFDSRPRIASGLVSGASAFGELQRLAARIDYSVEEANYGFALSTLSARLNRRSMIVLFTELTDIAAADFLVRAASRLVETHLLLIVVLRDFELEVLRDRRPETADDVTRAVTAAALLRDRLEVLTKLRHLGAFVVECDHDRVPEQLVQAYVDFRRRNLL